MPLHFNLLTLFPDMFPGHLNQSLSGRALEKGLWSYNAINIRDFAADKHKTVDDTPFGGGAGMVMRPDVIERALYSVNAPLFTTDPPQRPIYLSPRGAPLTQAKILELCQCKTVNILCGRYEGVDQRVLDVCAFEEISIGDYVLSGGEPAALILMDACIRLLPGVMGNENTTAEESFSNGLLEYPHYTRPALWSTQCGQDREVPAVLQSGNHAKIAQWRADQSLELTRARRPDLLKKLAD